MVLFNNRGRLTDDALVALAEHKLSAEDEQKVLQALENDSERKEHFQWMQAKIKELCNSPLEDDINDGQQDEWEEAFNGIFHAVFEAGETIRAHRTGKIIHPDFGSIVGQAANGDDTKAFEDYSREYALAADAPFPPENCNVYFSFTLADASHTGHMEFDRIDTDNVLCTFILSNTGLEEQCILLSISDFKVPFNLSADEADLVGSTKIPRKHAEEIYNELRNGTPVTAKFLP